MIDYDEKPKRKIKNDEFFLDPDHQKFKPGITHLRFEAVYNPYMNLGGHFLILSFTLLFALPIGLVFFPLLQEEISYHQQGIATNATLDSCRIVRSSAKNHSYDHVLNYHYDVLGMTYHGQDTFQSNLSNCNYEDQTVNIQYLEDSPNVSRVTGPYTIDNVGVTFVTLMFGLVPIGVAFRGFYYWFDSQRKYERLLRSGILLDGIILETKELRDHYALYYETISPDGNKLCRWQKRVRKEYQHTRLPEIGTPVTILYADDDCHVML